MKRKRWHLSSLIVALFACTAFACTVLATPSVTSADPITASIAGEVKTSEIDDDLRFANAQGADDAFVSYIVLEFDTTSLAGTTEIPALQFSLTQANASFTADGLLEFFVTDDTTTDITPGVSEAIRASETAVPNGIADGDLATLTSLGTGSFIETETGAVDLFTFPVSDTVETYLLDQIGSAGPWRFVVAAGELATQATYAGVDGGSSGDLSPPTVSVVPEPSTAMLGLLAALGLLATRRR